MAEPLLLETSNSGIGSLNFLLLLQASYGPTLDVKPHGRECGSSLPCDGKDLRTH